MSFTSYTQGRPHEFEVGGVSVLEGGGVSTVKTQNLKKGGGYMTPQLVWWRRPWLHLYNIRHVNSTFLQLLINFD